MKERAIVVGTAGADSGKIAIAWAAREASLHRRPLHIVHVLEWSPTEAREAGGSTYVERVWASSAAMTDAATRQVRDVAPEVDVTADTLVGHPAARLLDIAHDAELMVLGFRGHGGFAGLRLGSVGQRVATHAACPVVVVRGRSVTDGPIVAGVDDSPVADHVLDNAFAAAAVRAASLTVVRSFGPAGQRWAPAVRPSGIATLEQHAAEHALVEEQLAPWREKFPDVPVETLLTHDGIAASLVSASSSAQLVMVGSRGRGAIRGALLGSTGQHLLHHAECPVYVARPLAGHWS
jgi:nucleotide-binding universal stress UspA family protein